MAVLQPRAVPVGDLDESSTFAYRVFDIEISHGAKKSGWEMLSLHRYNENGGNFRGVTTPPAYFQRSVRVVGRFQEDIR